jgi:hypothetical protein
MLYIPIMSAVNYRAEQLKCFIEHYELTTIALALSGRER